MSLFGLVHRVLLAARTPPGFLHLIDASARCRPPLNCLARTLSDGNFYPRKLEHVRAEGSRHDTAGKSGKCLSASLQGLAPPVQSPVKTGLDQTWASALYSNPGEKQQNSIRLNYHCRSPRNESASPARAGQRRWSAIPSNQAIKPTSNVSTNQNFQ